MIWPVSEPTAVVQYIGDRGAEMKVRLDAISSFNQTFFRGDLI